MAQSIKCTHCGSLVKSANAVEPGKKIKCPKCAKLFVVAEDEEDNDSAEVEEQETAEEEETPKKKGKSPARDDDEEDAEGDKPKNKQGKNKKGKKGDRDDAPKKSNNMVLIAGIGGVLLLCCCAGGGGGTCLFWPSTNKDKPIAQDGKKTDKVFDNFDKADKADKGNKGLDKVLDKIVIDNRPNVGELKPEIVIDLKEFLKEYAADKEAAWKKIDGKVVEVTGQVKEVRVRWGFPLKNFTTGIFDPYFQIDLQPDQQEKLTRLAPNTKVKVVGRRPFQFNERITLNDCLLTELEPSNIPVISAEALMKDARANPYGTRDKYKLTDVIVSGVVENLDKGRNLATMKGQGTANWNISLASGEFDRLKQGDEVELRCQVPFIDDRKTKKGQSLELSDGIFVRKIK